MATEKILRLVLAVGVGLWVARYLGPVQFGLLGYCTALVTLLGFLPSLGLDAIVKRDLLLNPDETVELMASTVVLRLVAAGAAYIVVGLVAFGGWGIGAEERRLLVLLGLLLFQPAVFTPDLWLQAHLRASWSVAVQLTACVVCAAARVVLIWTQGTLMGFAAIVVAETALSGLGVWIAARHLGLRLSLAGVHSNAMKRLFKEAWPLMFATLAVIVYMKIDEVMLRHLAGPKEVGIYTAAAKLSEVWYFLPMMFASSVLPALLRTRMQDAPAYRLRMQYYYDLSAVAAYALSIPVALAAPWLVQIAYGNEFVGAGPILAVHIWSSVFVFLGIARSQWLVNERLQGFFLATTIAGALANILLNFIAIPRWGGLGAAYTTIVSYALAGWIGSFFHPAVRATGAMQTRALLIPFYGWRYLRRRSRI